MDWLDSPEVQAAITRRMVADQADPSIRWRYEQEECEINSPGCRRIHLLGPIVVLVAMLAAVTVPLANH